MSEDNQPTIVTKGVAKVSHLTLAIAVMLLANPAFAGLTGGLNKATSMATQIKTFLFGFFAIVAAIYLLIKFVECWGGRAEWKELGMSVLYVAGAGGAGYLANWAWNAFA